MGASFPASSRPRAPKGAWTLPRIDFADLPEHGRIWIFPAARALTEGERHALLEEVDAFLEGWAAHGAPLRSGRELVEDRFLVVGVDEDAARPSGCSIDALVNRLEALGAALGVGLLDHGPVWFREAGELRAVDRPTFRAMAEAGRVGPETPVVDTTLTRLADLRAGALERRAADGWHGRAFFRERRTG